jgi:hypothetical protein
VAAGTRPPSARHLTSIGTFSILPVNPFSCSPHAESYSLHRPDVMCEDATFTCARRRPRCVTRSRSDSSVRVALGSLACASTRFLSSWKPPDAGPLNFQGQKVARGLEMLPVTW